MGGARGVRWIAAEGNSAASTDAARARGSWGDPGECGLRCWDNQLCYRPGAGEEGRGRLGGDRRAAVRRAPAFPPPHRKAEELVPDPAPASACARVRLELGDSMVDRAQRCGEQAGSICICICIGLSPASRGRFPNASIVFWSTSVPLKPRDQAANLPAQRGVTKCDGNVAQRPWRHGLWGAAVTRAQKLRPVATWSCYRGSSAPCRRSAAPAHPASTLSPLRGSGAGMQALLEGGSQPITRQRQTHAAARDEAGPSLGAAAGAA